MRRLSLPALVLAVVLVPASLALAALGRETARRTIDRQLRHEAVQQREALDAYFERARAIILLTGHIPSFRQFYSAPRSRAAKVAADGREIANAKAALAYLERLYPDSIGEACFIDRGGAENARAVRGQLARVADLSPDESGNPFFAPAFALHPGQVYQARPYVSPDTGEWVIANATPVPGGGRRPRAIVHYEVTIESFRRAFAGASSGAAIKVIDARTGAVLIDSRTPQRRSAPLGAPKDRRFAALRMGAGSTGVVSVAGRRAAYERVRGGGANANDWFVVAVARAPAPTLMGSFGAGPLGMLIVAVLLLGFGLISLRAGHLSAQANSDDLTGLANRRAFLRRLERALADGARHERAAALLMIDLDHFKELNDTLGHPAGDQLLAQFGPRLHEAIRDADMLARLGGDEFAVLLTDVPDADAATGVAERIQAALEQPFVVEGLAVHVDASIGIALYPAHGVDGPGLLQRADVAMYEAKRQRTGSATYSADRDEHSRDRLALVNELRDALGTDELVLYYQPKACLHTGRVTGVEALVRWQHPEHGLLSPDAFLPVVEQAGLMRALTTHVLEAALAQAARWHHQGRGLTVAVNVSATDLVDAAFADQVQELLARHQVPAELLALEVTENTVMTDPERALDVLARLSEIGVGLSLDDFGTGYSSLAYVKRLPIRELKIDRSFVFNMDTDPQDATIVRSTIELANRLNLRVVAEGVETHASWSALGAMGAAQAQGYFLSRPLPAAELEAWVHDWEHDTLPALANA